MLKLVLKHNRIPTCNGGRQHSSGGYAATERAVFYPTMKMVECFPLSPAAPIDLLYARLHVMFDMTARAKRLRENAKRGSNILSIPTTVRSLFL